MACACLVGAYKLAQAIPLRPSPILASLAAASAAVWLGHRRHEALSERVNGWIYAAGIVAGVLGELVHYLIVGIPASVSKSVWWLAVGAGGIGGAIGIGMGVFVSIGWATASLFVFLWNNRRDPAA